MKNKKLTTEIDTKIDTNKFFNTKKKTRAIQDMVGTADDLKNVGTDANSVGVNNNWDGNLYTYSFSRMGK